MKDLIAHFSQRLGDDRIQGIIENEKKVFVVRVDCSLDETRRQLLKKCEASLQRAVTGSESGTPGDGWESV